MWSTYYAEDGGGVVLTRMFGDNPVADVPATIDGNPVIGVGTYCFSEKEPPGIEIPEESEAALREGAVRPLSGDYITEVRLPETVKSIGDLCFYGCCELRTVELYGADPVIGSDAFMNCHRLSHFILHTGVRERTSLRRILLQRTEATFVRFDDAEVYFPAYSEHYDLIGPAHIFELAIDGEGLRARQCFENEVFLPEAYDAVFEQATASEDEKTLCRMAASRLQFREQLPEDAARMYETYIREHVGAFAEDAVKSRDLTLVLGLAERGVLSQEQIKQCLLLTTRDRWVEGTRMLLAAGRG